MNSVESTLKWMLESCLYLPEGWICLNQAWALLGYLILLTLENVQNSVREFDEAMKRYIISHSLHIDNLACDCLNDAFNGKCLNLLFQILSLFWEYNLLNVHQLHCLNCSKHGNSPTFHFWCNQSQTQQMSFLLTCHQQVHVLHKFLDRVSTYWPRWDMSLC